MTLPAVARSLRDLRDAATAFAAECRTSISTRCASRSARRAPTRSCTPTAISDEPGTVRLRATMGDEGLVVEVATRAAAPRRAPTAPASDSACC